MKTGGERIHMKMFRITLDNEFEADTYTAILEDAQIPHILVSHYSSAYDGLFQMTMGWGHIEISEEYIEKAEELIKNFKESL